MYAWGFWTLIFGGQAGAEPEFWFGGTSNKISYMNSSHVLYCNGGAKISVLGKHSAKMYSSKTLKIFKKIYKTICRKILNILQNFSKIKFKKI